MSGMTTYFQAATEAMAGEGSSKKYRATINTGAVTANGRRYNLDGLKWHESGVPVLFNHGGYDFMSGLPVGHSDSIGLEGGVLKAEFHFGDDEHSKMVADKWESGLFNGISVGVYATKVSEENGDGNNSIQVVEEGTLLEFSVTPIPADFHARREALITEAASLVGTNSTMDELKLMIAKLQTTADKLGRAMARADEAELAKARARSRELLAAQVSS